jgi:hypothetical protein
MQIIWLSGSTANMHTFNITTKGLLKVFGATCMVFVLLGFAIHFFGFRLVLQLNPSLAHEIGGVISASEQSRIEDRYRKDFEKIQADLIRTAKTIEELNIINERYAKLLTPDGMKSRLDQLNSGGPFKSPKLDFDEKQGLAANLELAVTNSSSLSKSIGKLTQSRLAEYQWLESLPITPPIVGNLEVASHFGTRIDPFLKVAAFHPGIDFVAPKGRNIIATAGGRVIKAAVDAEYGEYIEIEHADRFISKYAHAQKLFVKAGDLVYRGQVIAEVGSTGRSTGPHLHYEIYKGGLLVNPLNVLHLNKGG